MFCDLNIVQKLQIVKHYLNNQYISLANLISALWFIDILDTNVRKHKQVSFNPTAVAERVVGFLSVLVL